MGSLDALQSLKIPLFAIERAERLMMSSPPPAHKIPDLLGRIRQLVS